MKRKITASCVMLMVFGLTVTFFSTGKINANSSQATEITYKAQKAEEKPLSDVVGDAVSGIGSGAMDAFGDIVSGIGSGNASGSGSAGGLLEGFGDVVGGIGSGGSGGGLLDGFGDIISGIIGSGNKDTSSTTYDIGYIDPVPAATQDVFGTQPQVQIPVETETEKVGETVDYALTENPYSKPESDFVAGDEDESIKWIQWIFIYTRYGLSDNGITGVLDEDTVAVVKKLQQEKGLTIDGNINADVVAAAELLFYEYTVGVPSTQPSEVTQMQQTTTENQNEDGNKNAIIMIVVIILSVIWIVAISAILVLFIMKRKKQRKAAQTTATNTNKETTISSISDLFDDVK